MIIASWNVNGFRAVERKGELQNFLQNYTPDVALLQETKSQIEDIPHIVEQFPEYEIFLNPAQKKGYSGTAIMVKKSVIQDHECISGLPNYEDTEGRVARVDFGDVSILGVYFPNGGKSPEAWEQKLIFYEKFLEYIDALRESGKKVIWGGDVNCAHNEIDLARPKENEGNIGFLPEERAWVSKVISHQWSDVFREKNPENVKYSWWTYRGGARERNVGWRIDYFFVDATLLPQVQKIEYLNDQMGSDHCPVLLEVEV